LWRWRIETPARIRRARRALSDRADGTRGRTRCASPSRRAVDDEHLAALLRDAVNDLESELCVECEREGLRAMRAGCSAPLGIHASLGEGRMTVQRRLRTGKTAF